MKKTTEKKELLKVGDRVLIDLFWTYTDNRGPEYTHPGEILDITKNQYYVAPDGLGAQYVWHASVIKSEAV